jgi:hypothetical protein
MRHMLTALLAVGLLAILTASSMAEDIFDPPWDCSLPNQTEQAWEFNPLPYGMVVGTPLPVGTQIEATSADNEYGWPLLICVDGAVPQVVDGPQGTPITALHPEDPDGDGYGRVSVTIKNNPDENLYKLIFWQVTANGSPTPRGDPPQTIPPGTSLPAPYPNHQWPNSSWYTYDGLLKIEPNPPQETITFEFAYCTSISEIVINTVCVPEPASASLSFAGLLGLLAVYGWRKRR